jgi:hypothetical protein
MFVALVTALTLAGGASSSSTSAPAASASPAAALREVVYKVSFTRRVKVSSEMYGGTVQNTESATNVSGQAPPFAETSTNVTDSGTVTVDVMQVAGDALGMRVTERWNGSTPSATYLGNVAPDGTVNFGGGQLNQCTLEILQYFGPAVMAGEPPNTGIEWKRTEPGQAADFDTKYSVGAIEGAVANIHEQTTIKSKSLAVMDSVETADVRYKPATLAPVSGRIVIHASRSGASSLTDVTTIANFDRVSDSRDNGT